MVGVGTLNGSLASKPKFLIPLQHGWEQETPAFLPPSARGGVLPIPRGNCFSGLSAMRDEEGEVILEKYGVLLALAPQTCPGTQPRDQ